MKPCLREIVTLCVEELVQFQTIYCVDIYVIGNFGSRLHCAITRFTPE